MSRSSGYIGLSDKPTQWRAFIDPSKTNLKVVSWFNEYEQPSVVVNHDQITEETVEHK